MNKKRKEFKFKEGLSLSLFSIKERTHFSPAPAHTHTHTDDIRYTDIEYRGRGVEGPAAGCWRQLTLTK